MAKWAAYAKVVGGKFLGIVEAETQEDAIKKANKLDSAYISFCHQCSGECENAEIEEVTVEEESK